MEMKMKRKVSLISQTIRLAGGEEKILPASQRRSVALSRAEHLDVIVDFLFLLIVCFLIIKELCVALSNSFCFIYESVMKV